MDPGSLHKFCGLPERQRARSRATKEACMAATRDTSCFERTSNSSWSHQFLWRRHSKTALWSHWIVAGNAPFYITEFRGFGAIWSSNRQFPSTKRWDTRGALFRPLSRTELTDWLDFLEGPVRFGGARRPRPTLPAMPAMTRE